MATPLVGSAGGSGDASLPATGFGPGTIIIAIIGAVLTATGALVCWLSRRPTQPTT